MHAEEAEGRRHDPVNQWGFFQVGNTVETGGHPVAGLEHIACNLRLHCIHVVHQMWRADDATYKNGGGKGNYGEVRIGSPYCNRAGRRSAITGAV